jgi:hypothetical protein
MELPRTEIIRITQSPYIYNTSRNPISRPTRSTLAGHGAISVSTMCMVRSRDGVRCLQSMGIRLLTPIEALSTTSSRRKLMVNNGRKNHDRLDVLLTDVSEVGHPR